MPSSNLKEKIREKVRQKLRERSQKDRKRVEGRVNIEGVTTPKHRKPKEVNHDHEHKKPSPASVSIGAHGGRYIQEASGHKRYVKEGNISGKKKIAKSSAGTAHIEDMVREIALENEKRDFVTKFKRRKSDERK